MSLPSPSFSYFLFSRYSISSCFPLRKSTTWRLQFYQPYHALHCLTYNGFYSVINKSLSLPPPAPMSHRDDDDHPSFFLPLLVGCRGRSTHTPAFRQRIGQAFLWVTSYNWVGKDLHPSFSLQALLLEMPVQNVCIYGYTPNNRLLETT